MVDITEAKRNLQKYEEDLYLLLKLNHLYSTDEFKQHCAKRQNQLKKLIAGIKTQFEESEGN